MIDELTRRLQLIALCCLAVGLLSACAADDDADTGPAETPPARVETPTATVAAAPPTETPPPTETATTAAEETPTPSVAGFAEEVIRLVNEERTAAGCPALEPNEILMQVARGHSEDMAEHGFLSHEGSEGRTLEDRLMDARYDFRLAAENVAEGQPTPEAVVRDWMESSGHRENILNCDYVETGVGVAVAPGDPFDDIYWTQVFGTPFS